MKLSAQSSKFKPHPDDYLIGDGDYENLYMMELSPQCPYAIAKNKKYPLNFYVLENNKYSQITMNNFHNTAERYVNLFQKYHNVNRIDRFKARRSK